MLDWYVFALLGFFLIGLQRFLYKVAASRGYSASRTTFSFMLTVALLSGFLYILWPTPLASPGLLLVFSLINSLGFVSATVAHISALRYLSGSIVFPVIRLNIVLVLLFSLLVLSESLDALQWLGVALSVLAFFLFSGMDDPDPDSTYSRNRKGWMALGLATVSGAVATVSSKLAADLGNLLAFIAISYAFSTLFSWLWMHISPEGREEGGKGQAAIWLGAGIGALNLAGFYFYLWALSLGPLSIVATINGMHFVVPVILSVAIYRDRLTVPRLVGIGATCAALILFRGF